MHSCIFPYPSLPIWQFISLSRWGGVRCGAESGGSPAREAGNNMLIWIDRFVMLNNMDVQNTVFAYSSSFTVWGEANTLTKHLVLVNSSLGGFVVRFGILLMEDILQPVAMYGEIPRFLVGLQNISISTAAGSRAKAWILLLFCLIWVQHQVQKPPEGCC